MCCCVYILILDSLVLFESLISDCGCVLCSLMDFNKEEAVRARGVAEEKLRNNDFGTARRIALRAKKLDSELENIDRICSVCDVHSAAENKVDGRDMDWYGILQVKQTDDELVIKKQYRKLAFLLHPDKNKYPGAEAAFKLIGEAQMVLLNDKNRQLRANTASGTAYSASCPNETPCTEKDPPVSDFTAVPKKKNPAHCRQNTKPKARAKAGDRVSFWTDCSICSFKNDFIVGRIGEPFMCQSCDKTFIPQTMSVGTKSCSKPTTPEMLKCADPAIWYEIFGFDETKAKGSRKRGAGACKLSVKKQRKSSNISQ